jgi:bacterioferritin (cytochrome b1)
MYIEPKHTEPKYTEPNLALLTAAFIPRAPGIQLSAPDHQQQRQNGLAAIVRLLYYEMAAVEAYRSVLALFPVLNYIGLNSVMMSNLGAHHTRADQLRGYLFRLGHHPEAQTSNQNCVIIPKSDESNPLFGIHNVLNSLAEMERKGLAHYRSELCHHLDEQSGRLIDTELLPAQERAASEIASLCRPVTNKNPPRDT